MFENLGLPFCEITFKCLVICSVYFDTWFPSPSELKKTHSRDVDPNGSNTSLDELD